MFAAIGLYQHPCLLGFKIDPLLLIGSKAERPSLTFAIVLRKKSRETVLRDLILPLKPSSRLTSPPTAKIDFAGNPGVWLAVGLAF